MHTPAPPTIAANGSYHLDIALRDDEQKIGYARVDKNAIFLFVEATRGSLHYYRFPFR